LHTCTYTSERSGPTPCRNSHFSLHDALPIYDAEVLLVADARVAYVVRVVLLPPAVRGCVRRRIGERRDRPGGNQRECDDTSGLGYRHGVSALLGHFFDPDRETRTSAI